MEIKDFPPSPGLIFYQTREWVRKLNSGEYLSENPLSVRPDFMVFIGKKSPLYFNFFHSKSISLKFKT